jgi:uncharacterized protein (DUF58 family)
VIIPSRRWLLIAASLALLAPLSLLWPSASDVLLVADALWVVALMIDVLRIGSIDIPAFPVTREAPPAFSVDRPLPVRYQWQNPTRRPLVIEVREHLPVVLRLAAGDERSVIVAPGAATEELLDFLPVRRGKASGGTLDLRIRGPWRLAWRQGRRALPWNVTVYPSLRHAALRALATQTQRRQVAGFRNTRRIGEGRLFESLKEWVPGDEIRSIDWKATARHGKAMSRQYEDERRQHVMIVIDAGRLLTAEVDGRARLESAIDTALQLAHSAVQHDDNVGLLVFADQVQQFIAPTRGRRALGQLLEALAAVEGRLVESNYPVAFAWLAARSRKRALTVFLTDVVDRTASDALLAQAGALRPRHVPLVVVFRDPALERTASLRATTLDEAYTRAAAEELLEARELALGELRSRGVLVLDVLPDGAARAVVEQYQQLKRRALV